MTRKASRFSYRFAGMAAAVTMLALVPAAFAGKGPGPGKGSGGTTATSQGTSSSCVQAAPGVVVQNNYAWGTSGSWGMPGQQLGYDIQVVNYDVGCASTSFVVSVSTPSGFSVSIPTNTITLAASSSGYLWAYVTSPFGAADGDYPLTVSVTRSGATAPDASRSTYYKLYSSDTTAPTLFWSNPSAGQTISGSSYTVNVSSSDDHAVKELDFYLDGAFVTTASCDDVTYICQLSYKWSLRHARGQHTATFKSYDWFGNVGVSTFSFTVSK